jgi:hypothetical protein
MIVYIVTRGWYYEGEEVIGVFDTQQKAEDFKAKGHGYCDFIDITEWEVN